MTMDRARRIQLLVASMGERINGNRLYQNEQQMKIESAAVVSATCNNTYFLAVIDSERWSYDDIVCKVFSYTTLTISICSKFWKSSNQTEYFDSR